jgi:hypothetical protein
MPKLKQSDVLTIFWDFVELTSKFKNNFKLTKKRKNNLLV